MAQATDSSSNPARISVEIDSSIRRRLEIAAAAHDQTIGQYVLDAIEARLRHDKGNLADADAVMAASDPVLAELWDNPRDAGYDRPRLPG